MASRQLEQCTPGWLAGKFAFKLDWLFCLTPQIEGWREQAQRLVEDGVCVGQLFLQILVRWDPVRSQFVYLLHYFGLN